MPYIHGSYVFFFEFAYHFLKIISFSRLKKTQKKNPTTKKATTTGQESSKPPTKLDYPLVGPGILAPWIIPKTKDQPLCLFLDFQGYNGSSSQC